MALFIDSTQSTHWTIPSDQLAERRARTNTRAQSLRHHQQEDGLSIDEEAIIRTYHEKRILKFIRSTGLPEKLGATAITYFKRFFIDRSVTEFNPSVIVLSALYAAGKVEEIYLPADRLIIDFDSMVNKISKNDNDVPDQTATKVDENALLQTELSFLQRLQFHLVCYHGFRSLGALRELLKQKHIWTSSTDDQQETDILRRVCHTAHNFIAWHVPLTELVITESPAVIVLAAIAVAAVNEQVEESDDAAIDKILQAAAAGKDGVASSVRSAVWTIREAGVDEKIDEQDIELMKDLEKRRRNFQIQENDPMSEKFKQLKDEEDERRFVQGREKSKDSKKRQRSGEDSWSDDGDAATGDKSFVNGSHTNNTESNGDGEDSETNNDVRALNHMPSDRNNVKRPRLEHV